MCVCQLIVVGRDDAVADGDQLFTVTFVAFSETDSVYSGITANMQATNMDDDDAGVNFYAKDLPITYEESINDSFDVFVKLFSQPFSPVVFKITSSDPTEGLVALHSNSPRMESVSLQVFPQ